jgi:hypothetical protein
MNHTTKTLVITVGMLAIAAALIGAVAVSVLLPAAHAVTNTSYGSKDPGKKNSIDFENSESNFHFKKKLKNNCSGFARCSNTAQEALGGV